MISDDGRDRSSSSVGRSPVASSKMHWESVS